MSFCKYCSNLLRIVKNDDYNEDNVKNLEPDDMVTILLDKLNAKNSNYNNSEYLYQINFPISDLKKITIKQKTFPESINVEEELKILYEEIIKQNKNANLFNYICNNCSMTYYLKPGTIIDTINYENNDVVQDEIPSIRVDDQTLFRTKNFICINNKCISNTDKSDKVQRAKEAVFYKLKHHNIKYICTQCNANWGT